MGLSSDLISQFVKITNDEPKQTVPSMIYGTVKYVGATPYVRLDGASEDVLTPIVTTTAMQPDERVMVTINNHTAVVVGNVSSPSVNLETPINNGTSEPVKIGQFGILLAEKANIKELDAAIANIDSLKADKVVIDDLNVEIASINNLKADKAMIDVLNANIARIDDLKADKVTIDDLSAEIANINDLKADKASIENLSSAYASIDFANIGEAAIQKLFSQSGIINELVMSEGHVTGELVGVTLKGSLIEGGTIVADKLVVLGDDGLYYKLNTNGEKITASQTEYNSLNGSIITAKSVTAEKIRVEDLVAFGATIGGFKIDDNSIHSTAKVAINNNNPGIFLDSTGQVAFGDSNNFLKYYYDSSSQKYKLEVSADTVTFGVGKKNVETALKDIQTEVDNIEIGGRNLLPDTDFDGASKRYEKLEGYTTEGGFHFYTTNQINSGETYTLSAKIRGNANIVFYEIASVGGNKSHFWIKRSELSENNYNKFVITFTVDDTRTFSDAYICTQWGDANTLTGDWFEIEPKSLKLEKGNKATDWTPAPEDVDETIINSSDEVRQEIVDRSATIVAEAEGIVTEALRSYTKTDDFNSFKEEAVSSIKQNADDISLNFTKTTETTTALDDDLQNTKETISKHFEFTEKGLTIKMGENAMKLRLDNDLIGFYKGDIDEADLTKNRFGWWDGVDFHTGNIVVEVNERAQFGNFAFVPRSDGSLMFLKVGG